MSTVYSRSLLAVAMVVAVLFGQESKIQAAWAEQFSDRTIFSYSQHLTESTMLPIGNGCVIAITSSYDRFAGSVDISAQRFGSDGNPQWGENGISICSTPAREHPTAVLDDGYDGCFIVWQDNRDHGSGVGGDIYGQHITKNGEKLWEAGGRPLVASVSELNLVTFSYSDGDGGFVLNYSSIYQGLEYTKRFSAFGYEVPFGASVRTEEMVPIVGGQFMSVSVRDTGTRQGLGVMLFSPSGDRVWESERQILENVSVDIVKVISSQEGGLLLAWSVADGYNHWRTYLGKVNTEGQLEWEIEHLQSAPGTPLELSTQVLSGIVESSTGEVFMMLNGFLDAPTVSKYSKAGVALWDSPTPLRAYDGNSGFRFLDWKAGTQGSLFIIMQSEFGFDGGHYETFILRMRSDGSLGGDPLDPVIEDPHDTDTYVGKPDLIIDPSAIYMRAKKNKASIYGNLYVRNAGDVASVPTVVAVYLRPNGITTEGQEITRVAVPALSPGATAIIAPGQKPAKKEGKKGKKLKFTIAKGTSIAGQFLRSIVDPDNLNIESNETNNLYASGRL